MPIKRTDVKSMNLKKEEDKIKGFTLMEAILIISILGILLLISATSIIGIYDKARLKYEINQLNKAIRKAYKDAVLNEAYIGMELYRFPPRLQERDYFLIYKEDNGILGYQEGEDEELCKYHFPLDIKIYSVGGISESGLLITPSGLIRGEFNSDKYPGYAHIELRIKRYFGIIRLSKIGELKIIWR